MLISDVQRSDSILQTHIDTHIRVYTHSFIIFFYIMVYHRIVNIVLCTMQQHLVVYPSYI